MRLLTNYCTATPPALASFEIIARRKRLGGCVGFLLPVKARAGRVNRGVSHLPRGNEVVWLLPFPRNNASAMKR